MGRRWPGPVQRTINLAFLAGVNAYQIASCRHVPRIVGETRRSARLARRTVFPLRVGELQPMPGSSTPTASSIRTD